MYSSKTWDRDEKKRWQCRGRWRRERNSLKKHPKLSNHPTDSWSFPSLQGGSRCQDTWWCLIVFCLFTPGINVRLWWWSNHKWTIIMQPRRHFEIWLLRPHSEVLDHIHSANVIVLKCNTRRSHNSNFLLGWRVSTKDTGWFLLQLEIVNGVHVYLHTERSSEIYHSRSTWSRILMSTWDWTTQDAC